MVSPSIPSTCFFLSHVDLFNPSATVFSCLINETNVKANKIFTENKDLVFFQINGKFP